MLHVSKLASEAGIDLMCNNYDQKLANIVIIQRKQCMSLCFVGSNPTINTNINGGMAKLEDATDLKSVP